MVEVAGMKPDEEIISFTRNEWKHLLDEIEMRGVNEIEKSQEQLEKGHIVTKTWEELEAMAL